MTADRPAVAVHVAPDGSASAAVTWPRRQAGVVCRAETREEAVRGLLAMVEAMAEEVRAELNRA